MASTATETVTNAASTAAQVLRNPKDSMKSTWRQDKKVWSLPHYLMYYTGILPPEQNSKIPVHEPDAPMPYITQYENHKWVLFHAIWPMAVQQIYIWTTGKNFNFIGCFLFYTLAYKLNGMHELNLLRMLGTKYGYLDGTKHKRDEVPDHSVQTVLNSLLLTASLRPLMSLFLAWKPDMQPIDISPWVVLEIGVYGIVLDFWFYWYHRVMHANESLWKYHRTHHLTKHPNALLTLYADEEQEFFDIVGVPFLTWCTMKMLGFPMGYFDWWMCHKYIVYTELFGHSGLRTYSETPSSLTWLLSYFNAGLIIEDHDLHHRKGWKKSHNYGKVTRIWDLVFGTTYERPESQNIDYNNTVKLPLWW